MKITLIRHGKTAGNLEKRYIGRMDEPLCDAGISALKHRSYPNCELVIASPMKRCLQTAEILYPDKKTVILEALRECDFGDFEGKNYLELSEDPDYQRWIDSGGTTAFPKGESPDSFKKRCVAAFDEVVRKYADAESICFVVHGGTIMSILAAYAGGDYFDFQVQNGAGYVTEFDGETLTILERI